MRFDVRRFALTSALVWGLGVFAMTWWFIALGGATGEVTIIGHLYRGYTVSPFGSIVGLLWAVADGFVFGALFAWTYNALGKQYVASTARSGC